MKNHRKLRDESCKPTWDPYPNSLDIIGQLVCTYAQQHECRIKCLISQHQKQYWSPNSLHLSIRLIIKLLDVPNYQIVWTTSQASRDATFNSLEQFQLVQSKFKHFAPALHWIFGRKYKQVGLKVIFFIGSIKLLDVPRDQIVWTTSQASRDATSNYLEQFQLVDSKFKLFAPDMYL
jgi:hypothetical protein